MEDMISVSTAAVIECVLTVVAFVFLMTRLLIRKRERFLSFADMLATAGFGLMVIFVVTNIVAAKALPALMHLRLDISGSGRSPDLSPLFLDPRQNTAFLKLLYIASPHWAYWSLYCTKGSFIIFYFKIFPSRHPKLVIVLTSTAAFTVTSCVVTELVNYFWCLPVSNNWSLDANVVCIAAIFPFPQTLSFALHIVSDMLIIFVLPLALLPFLNISATQKRAFALTFCICAVSILCSAARYTFSALTRLWGPTALLFTAEMAASIIVSCMPAIKRLYTENRRRRSASSRSGFGGTTTSDLTSFTPPPVRSERRQEVWDQIDLEEFRRYQAGQIRGNGLDSARTITPPRLVLVIPDVDHSGSRVDMGEFSYDNLHTPSSASCIGVPV